MGRSHLQCARKRQADHGGRANEHADCDELAFAIRSLHARFALLP